MSFSYNKYLPDVKLYYVKHISNVFEDEEGVMPYFDIKTLLHEILKETKCDSTSMIAISNNAWFLKEMMNDHIGTILTGQVKNDFLKNTPDFKVRKLEQLASILKNRILGYGAEVCAICGEPRSYMSLLIYKDDLLSFVICRYKANYVKAVDEFFDSVISLIRKDNAKNGVKLQNILVCNKDFFQKENDLNMRKEMVKDAFSVSVDVKGKNVII